MLSLLPATNESYMFQTPEKAILEQQAAALDLPLITQPTQALQEEELNDLKILLGRAQEKYHLDGIAVGALASDYQFVRVQHICHELGLRTYAPLWHKRQLPYMEELASWFDIRMTSIAAEGLGESWLGKRLTMEDVKKLEQLHNKIGLHPAGEGGEFETIALDGPFFKKPIAITYSKKMENPHVGRLHFKSTSSS